MIYESMNAIAIDDNEHTFVFMGERLVKYAFADGLSNEKNVKFLAMYVFVFGIRHKWQSHQ